MNKAGEYLAEIPGFKPAGMSTSTRMQRRKRRRRTGWTCMLFWVCSMSASSALRSKSKMVSLRQLTSLLNLPCIVALLSYHSSSTDFDTVHRAGTTQGHRMRLQRFWHCSVVRDASTGPFPRSGKGCVVPKSLGMGAHTPPSFS